MPQQKKQNRLTYDQHDRRSDDTENGDVVDGHPHQPGVIDLLHLLGTGLVGQEQAQDQLEALVRVENTWKKRRTFFEKKDLVYSRSLLS